jgi:hypothetical protein
MIMTLKTPGRCVGIFSALSRFVFLVSLLVASAAVSEQLSTKHESGEDWTSLSVKGLGLQSLPPMPGGTVERPEFTREFVRLQWRSGDPVDIFVILPHGVRKPHVILYLYGYPSDLTRFTNDQWCKAATAGGFAAVGFVSALTGERYHGRPMKEWFVSELQESLGKSTHDVQKVVDYLEGRGDLTAERVGMYAQGSGASVAILTASVDPRIAVLDLLNPWCDWPDWLKQSALVPENERPAYLHSEFLKRVEMLEPVQILPKLNTQILRVQQTADDLITPKTAREKMAAAIPHGAQIMQYDNWTSYRKAWQEKNLWEWIKEQLDRSLARSSTRQPEPASLADDHR